MAPQPLVGQGLFITDASRPRSVTHTANSMTPRRRDLYLTTQKTHDRETYMSPAEFEPAITASGRRTTPSIARTLGSACNCVAYNNKNCYETSHAKLSFINPENNN